MLQGLPTHASGYPVYHSGIGKGKKKSERWPWLQILESYHSAEIGTPRDF